MVRPVKPRCLKGNPKVYYFKPQGVALKYLDEVILLPDEFEAIRLYGRDGLDQSAAAKKMQISQPTFARIVKRAYTKIAQALVDGKAIRIDEE